MKLEVNGKDISKFYSSITWSGDKEGAARKLDFGVVVSGTDPNLPKLTIMQRDEVILYNDNGAIIFKGQVLNKEKSIDSNIMTVNCADLLLKANNSNLSFSFEGKSPNEIATEVLGAIDLEVGELEGGEPIDRTFDIMSAYNIIYTAYKLENEKSGKPFMIRMNDGKVDVVEQGKNVARWTLDGKSTLLNSTYSESSENSISHVKIFDTEGNQVGEVLGDVADGGVEIYRQEKDENPKARAEELLKGIERSASIRAFGDYDLITGNAVMVKEPFTGLIGKFYIVGDTHHFENNAHFVDLELSYDNIMNDIDTSLPSNNADDVVSALSGPLSSKVLQAGSSVTGSRYLYGGNNPSTGIDCSGFVQWSYKQAGANIPGRLTSAELRKNPKQYGFVEIPFSERSPGDVLWQSGHVALQYDSSRIIESGGVSKNIMGYSGVAISNQRGRTFSKAYRYVGGV